LYSIGGRKRQWNCTWYNSIAWIWTGIDTLQLQMRRLVQSRSLFSRSHCTIAFEPAMWIFSCHCSIFGMRFPCFDCAYRMWNQCYFRAIYSDFAPMLTDSRCIIAGRGTFDEEKWQNQHDLFNFDNFVRNFSSNYSYRNLFR
jgi:hypothetical protein